MALLFILLAFFFFCIVMFVRSRRKHKKNQKTNVAEDVVTIELDLNEIMREATIPQGTKINFVAPKPIAPPGPDIPMFDTQRQYKGGRAFQLLESIYIVETTKNYDTLSGRIDFIVGMYHKFIPASKSHLYQGQMAKVFDYYKTMYPDRELTGYQISLSLLPSIENMQLFYSECIVRFYERYVSEQTAEMNALKTVAARERRQENMSAKGYLARKLFGRYQLPDIGHIDRINALRKTVREQEVNPQNHSK